MARCRRWWRGWPDASGKGGGGLLRLLEIGAGGVIFVANRASLFDSAGEDDALVIPAGAGIILAVRHQREDDYH